MDERKVDRATRRALLESEGVFWRSTLLGHVKRVRCYLFGHELEQYLELVDYEDGEPDHHEMWVRCKRCIVAAVVFCWDCG